MKLTNQGRTLFDIPYQRHSKTSRAAARKVKPDADRVRVFQYLCEHPDGATDEEMQIALNLNGSTQRPRRISLVESGVVINSNRTRLTRPNRPAVVWAARGTG